MPVTEMYWSVFVSARQKFRIGFFTAKTVYTFMWDLKWKTETRFCDVVLFGNFSSSRQSCFAVLFSKTYFRL